MDHAPIQSDAPARSGGRLRTLLATGLGLAVLGSAGCERSRASTYDDVLKGTVRASAAEPDRFISVFPESAAFDLASVDVDR